MPMTRAYEEIVSFQKDVARLGCVPGGPPVEDRGSFRHEAGEGWHLKGAGDAVMDVVRKLTPS